MMGFSRKGMGRAGLRAEASRMSPQRAGFRGLFSLKIGGEGRGTNGHPFRRHRPARRPVLLSSPRLPPPKLRRGQCLARLDRSTQYAAVVIVRKTGAADDWMPRLKRRMTVESVSGILNPEPQRS